jgi:cell division protein FtsL
MLRADRPVDALLLGLWAPPGRLALLLAVLLVLSSLAAIQASHRTRSLFAELEMLRMERDGLLEQQGRLLLERSAFSAYNRVESVATDRLGMRMPGPGETLLVQP